MVLGGELTPVAKLTGPAPRVTPSRVTVRRNWITGDEWRILGKEVKVELWVQNPGDKDVKFQLNMRPDIGLRMTMKDEKGAEHEASIVPRSRATSSARRASNPCPSAKP